MHHSLKIKMELSGGTSTLNDSIKSFSYLQRAKSWTGEMKDTGETGSQVLPVTCPVGTWALVLTVEMPFCPESAF